MSDSEQETTLAIQKESSDEQFSDMRDVTADTAKSNSDACDWNLDLDMNMHADSNDCLNSEPMAAGVDSSPNPAIPSSPRSVSDDSNSELKTAISPDGQGVAGDGQLDSGRIDNFREENQNSESVFDDFSDFQADASWQEELQREDTGQNESYTKQNTLEELEEDATQPRGNSDNLIADIFGDSEGEEEFEGFERRKIKRIEDDDEDDQDDEKPNLDDNEVEKDENQAIHSKEDDDEKEGSEKGETSQTQATEEPSAEAALPELSSDESGDESTRKRKLPEDFVYDFDIMMQKRKESFRRRKRKNVDSIINDSDDVIAELIQEMKQAAEDDFQLNKDRKAATRKLKLLPVVDSQLRKIDLREAFLDAGVLSVITDWLTPLPDRSLPNLQVRETLIKLLSELNIMDVERLKASGIGKAIMYLFKHPKETKENKRRAGALISTWARPIFNLDSDFHSMSKEEREQRDFEHMTKTKRRMSDVNEVTPSRLKSSDEKAVRPGEKGWIPRARVPMPSTRDYVIRPKSNVETEASRSGNKKAVTRLDKYLRTFREKKKQTKVQRAVPISIEGRKMSL